MEFLSSFPDASTVCALQQSAQYARALQRLNTDTECLVIMKDARQVASLLVVKRRFGPFSVIWLPRGPAWANAPSGDRRAEVMRRLPMAMPGRHIWILSPDTQMDVENLRHQVLMTPQHVAEVDLTQSQDARLAAQNGKWRNRLRHAEKSDLRVVHHPFDPMRDAVLLSLETAQRDKRRYRALPESFLRAWTAANPKDTRLFTVLQGTTPMAYLLVLLHTPAATYHIGWTGIEGRRHSAHNLALWTAQNWLAERGYRRFDLGTVDTQNTPGLARFKIGSGAHVRVLGPTCLHVPRFEFSRRIRHDAA